MIKLRFLCYVFLVIASHAGAQTIVAVTHTTPLSQQVAGNVIGAAPEIARLSLQQAQLSDFSIKLYPWARAIDMAKKLPNVLIFPIARTQARETQFKWVGEISKTQFHFYKLKARTEIQAKNLQEIKQFRVGVVRDTTRHQFLQEQGLHSLILSARAEDNFQKLFRREVDIVPLNDEQPASLCAQTQLDCTQLEKIISIEEMSTGLYLAFSNATSDEIVGRVRLAFARLQKEGKLEKILRSNKPVAQ